MHPGDLGGGRSDHSDLRASGATTTAARELAGVAAAAVLSWATAADAMGTGKWLQLCCLLSRHPRPCWPWCWGPCTLAILAVATCLVLVGVVFAAFMVVVVAVLAEVLVP